MNEKDELQSIQASQETIDDLDNAYGGFTENTKEFKDERDEIIGYADYFIKDGVLYMRNIRVTERGIGYGRAIIDYLFSTLNISEISGHAILEPAEFWMSIGSTFEYEPTEESYDGECFVLKKENFK